MNTHFVTTGRTAELQVISQLRPAHILVSYHYFKNKRLADLVADIGYSPKIMLDSGAYSAWSSGKDVALTAYLRYVEDNWDHISEYIALDVIGNPLMSLRYYDIMYEEGFYGCVPVYHFGASEDYLEEYLARGAKRIALGNTVPELNKKKVVDWVNYLCGKYPDVSFHLLGSSHHLILDGAKDLTSHDSSTWILMAANGFPKDIPGTGREDKIKRMIANMARLMERMIAA